MVTSVNKGYELIVTGTQIDTWGNVLNASVFALVDRNLGGTVTKSLTNVQVDLDATESQNMRLVLNGTLTGNVLVTTQCVGFTVVENNTTGAFSVTFQKNGVGSPVTLPQGSKTLVVTGATGNPGLVGVDFPAGTRMLFQQTTPPPGWTKDVTAFFNDCALRLVAGSVVNGGSAAFSAVFASRTPSGAVNPTALSIAQIPSHQHFEFNGDVVSPGSNLTGSTYPTQNGISNTSVAYSIAGSSTVANIGLSSPTGGGSTHDHGLTMTAMDFAVKFTDFTIGVKQ